MLISGRPARPEVSVAWRGRSGQGHSSGQRGKLSCGIRPQRLCRQHIGRGQTNREEFCLRDKQSFADAPTSAAHFSEPQPVSEIVADSNETRWPAPNALLNERHVQRPNSWIDKFNARKPYLDRLSCHAI